MSSISGGGGIELKNIKTISAIVDKDVVAGDKVIIDTSPPETTMLESYPTSTIYANYLSPDEELLICCSAASPSIALYKRNSVTKKYEQQNFVFSSVFASPKYWLTISPDWKYIIAGNGVSNASHYPTVVLLKITDNGDGTYKLEETSTSVAFSKANEVVNVYRGQFYDNRTAIVPTSVGIKIWRINEDESVTTVKTEGALSTLRDLKMTSDKSIVLASCATVTTPLLGWALAYDSGTDIFTFTAKSIPYEVTTHAGYFLDINSSDDRVALTSNTMSAYSRHVFFWEITGAGALNVIPWPGSGSWYVQYNFPANPVFSKTSPYLCMVNGTYGGNRVYIINTASTTNWAPISIETASIGPIELLSNMALADGSFMWISSRGVTYTVWYDTSVSLWKFGTRFRGLSTHVNASMNVERTYGASCLSLASVKIYKKNSNGFFDTFYEHVGTGTVSNSAYTLAWLDEYHLLVQYYSSIASERLKLFTINPADDSVTISYADVAVASWLVDCGLIHSPTNSNVWYWSIANWTTSASYIYKIDLTANTITKLANPTTLPTVSCGYLRTYGTSILLGSTANTTTETFYKYDLDESGGTPIFVKDTIVPFKDTKSELCYHWMMLNDTTAVTETRYNNYLIVYKLIDGAWVKQSNYPWSIIYPTSTNAFFKNIHFVSSQPGSAFNGYNHMMLDDEGVLRETNLNYGMLLLSNGVYLPDPYPEKLITSTNHQILNTETLLAYKMDSATQNPGTKMPEGRVKYDASARTNAVIQMELI